MKRRLLPLFGIIALALALLAAACQPSSPPPAPTPVRVPEELGLTWPAFGEAVDASPLLQWEAFPGATHYQVTVADQASAVILVQDTTHPLFRVTPELPKGLGYSWNVQAQNSQHVVLAELNSQFSVMADLVLVWPPDREAVDGTPVLQWQGFPGAVQYQVVILADEAYPPRVEIDQTVNEPSYAVSPPLGAGHYSWTVRAQDSHQAVLAELNSRFSVKAHLTLLDPADGAEVSAAPTLRWAPFEGATQYQVIVVQADTYPPVVVLDSIIKGTELVVNPPLKAENGYSLTIRAMTRGRAVLAESNTTFRVYTTGPFFDCGSVRGLSAAECQALVTLYSETSGPTWAGSAEWLANDTPCEWSGVTCTDGHVTDLNLFFKEMKGSLPAALADLTHLRVLALRDNQLTGAIPPALGRLEHLTYLDFSRNALSGSLPAELGQLGALELVFLNANQLSGELPAAWGNLAALRHLDLSHNALTGAIPAEWGQLQQLEALRLGNNQLSGQVPAEIGALAQLTELDVSDNQLSGPVPAPILALPYRALWGNQLDGTIRCEGAPPMAVDYQGISFICFSSLGASVWPEVLPAIPPNESAPFWEARPEHVRFTLAEAPGAAQHVPMGAALSNQAQVMVWPTDGFEALDRMVRLEFGDLRALLAERPAAIEGELPLLPLNNAGQMLHARVHYLDFANGSGVAYLTQFAMGPNAVNNQELLYTFQGFTDDREYYVAAFLPVSLPSLPATAQLSDDDFAAIMADYEGYLLDMVVHLEEQPAEAFSPDLAQIDRLIQSLVITGARP
jgi:hypothetical protein